MAYTANYSSDDLSSVVIDIIVGVGVAVVGFAGLAGLILLYGWAKKKAKF